VGWLEPERLSRFSTEGAGQFRIRTIPGAEGQHPPSAKLLKGLGGGTVELIDDFDGDTYRAVYTVRLESAVYVLHAFKKKSKQGSKTPQSDIDLIKRRLKDAEADHTARTKQESNK
jgi:phage-related protein